MIRIVGFLAGAVAILAFGYLGGLAALGAHPDWALLVPALGLIGATGIYGIGVLRPRVGLILAVVALVAGVAAGRLGGAAFAASFGEDARAAALWFFGWIVASGGGAALVGLQVDRALARR